MGARGPKSGDELATVQAPEVVARLDADYSLRDEESEIWKSVVEAHPADWFNPGSAHLLAGFCRAVVSARRIGMLIVQEEQSADYDVSRHLALIRAHGEVQRTLKAQATSLRLTPQSRYTPASAARQGRSDGPKPWEFRGRSE